MSKIDVVAIWWGIQCRDVTSPRGCGIYPIKTRSIGSVRCLGRPNPGVSSRCHVLMYLVAALLPRPR